MPKIQWTNLPPALRDHYSPKVMRASSSFSRLLLALVARLRQPIREIEEAPSLSFPGLETGLDQVDEDAVGTGSIRLRQGSHPAGDAGGKAYTLADGFLVDGIEPEYTISHHYAAPFRPGWRTNPPDGSLVPR